MLRRGVMCAAILAGGCRVGLHGYQSRTSGPRTLTHEVDPILGESRPAMGTAELSERLSGLDIGAFVVSKPYKLEIGATLGISNPRVGEVTGDFPPPDRSTQESGWQIEDISVYDALYVGASVPVATLDDVKVNAYGKASAVAGARWVRTTTGPDFMLEGGIEVAMPLTEPNGVFVRLGYQIERASISLEVPFSFSDDGGYMKGTATFSGFTTGIGFYWGRD